MMAQEKRVKFSLLECLFLGASLFIWSLAQTTAAFQLPHCQLINKTISLEKRGCSRCHRVETTICSGYCTTKDPNMKIVLSKPIQHVCTYGELYYKTFEFPDCLPGVDPVVTYPVALRCHCGGCAMATSDCTFESLQPDFCINNIPFYH
ncbi:gonadotropin subunit beta-2-like isoform X1 [Poeciliopsis prolifica]|uniref:gonadotropin subunit beta-2-like isoform X1 n=1 Tax=Poeciliopsis prolifica TaxID=188132 RepID=UPI0024145F1D|nr:gonadotropin subunit beta-2-like isoform X1 [Poeciliopsis prolifica]